MISTETFEKWDMDLLIDYVLKFHHRNTRVHGARIANELLALCRKHTELNEVADLFRNSIQDLDMHCMKEENVLYPYINDLYEAAENNQPIGSFHCGTIQYPIEAMMSDHSEELGRHNLIERLTNSYTAPEGSEPEYQKVLDELRDFRDYLKEHITVENEVIFPRALRLEAEHVDISVNA